MRPRAFQSLTPLTGLPNTRYAAQCWSCDGLSRDRSNHAWSCRYGLIPWARVTGNSTLPSVLSRVPFGACSYAVDRLPHSFLLCALLLAFLPVSTTTRRKPPDPSPWPPCPLDSHPVSPARPTLQVAQVAFQRRQDVHGKGRGPWHLVVLRTNRQIRARMHVSAAQLPGQLSAPVYRPLGDGASCPLSSRRRPLPRHWPMPLVARGAHPCCILFPTVCARAAQRLWQTLPSLLSRPIRRFQLFFSVSYRKPINRKENYSGTAVCSESSDWRPIVPCLVGGLAASGGDSAATGAGSLDVIDGTRECGETVLEAFPARRVERLTSLVSCCLRHIRNHRPLVAGRSLIQRCAGLCCGRR